MTSKKPQKTTLSFAERLAAAKAAARPTRDVEIILDAGLGSKIDALRDELMVAQSEETADIRLGQGFPKSDAVQEKLDAALAEAVDQVVTLRFVQMPAPEWADAVARSPIRLDVDIDAHYGFNTDMVAAIAAPLSGVRLEDDAEYGLTDEEWRDLFATITGHELTLIADAIFDLNVATPGRRLADAKKASKALQD